MTTDYPGGSLAAATQALEDAQAAARKVAELAHHRYQQDAEFHARVYQACQIAAQDRPRRPTASVSVERDLMTRAASIALYLEDDRQLTRELARRPR